MHTGRPQRNTLVCAGHLTGARRMERGDVGENTHEKDIIVEVCYDADLFRKL